MSRNKNNWDFLVNPEGQYEPLAGQKGQKGDPGGLKGRKGLKGIKGDEGTAGTNGTDGTKGQKGIQGFGDKGIKGNKGLGGTKGNKGIDGTLGAKGLKGAKGEGAKGQKGADGVGDVSSVNTQKGDVVLTATDVEALPIEGGTMKGALRIDANRQATATNSFIIKGRATPGGADTEQLFKSYIHSTGSSTNLRDWVQYTGETDTTDFQLQTRLSVSNTLADYLNLTDGGVVAGDTTYTGDVLANDSVQTKDSVNTLIASAVSQGFIFKGTTDVTGVAPTSPAGGDFYINLTGGIADASWTGLAGLTVSADQLVIYSSSESRWFAGAVENNTSYVLKAGDTMTGELVIESSAFLNALTISDGTNITSQLQKTGDAFFNGTLQCRDVNCEDVLPLVTNTSVLGNTTNRWLSADVTTVTASVVNSGTLAVDGVCTLGSVGTSSRITVGSVQGVGSTASPTYYLEGGASANLVIDRCADNSMSIPQMVIQGKVGTDGVKTSNLLEVFRLSGNVADAIRYFGRTTSNNDIQNKTSALSLITDGNWTVTNPVTFNESVTVGSTSSAHPFFQYGTFQIKKPNDAVAIQLTSDGLIDCTDFLSVGTATFSGVLNNGTNGSINIVRPTGSLWVRVQGRTTSAGSLTSTLIDLVKGAGNAVDKALYYGDTTSTGKLIQTKDSVDTLISAAAGGGTYTTQNAANTPAGDTDLNGSVWYVKTKLVQGGTAVSIIINMGASGAQMGFNTKLCKLPSQFLGTRHVAIPVVSKVTDSPVKMGFVYLNVDTGQLTLGQLVPSSVSSGGSTIPTTSQEWEGAMVYPID